MRISKLSTLLLSVILVTGCEINSQNSRAYNSINVNNASNYESGDFSIITLNNTDIENLNNEYSFKTKALTAGYFKNKLLKLIGSDNGLSNSTKIIKELQYARVKGESVIPFKEISNSEPSFYTAITGVVAVINTRANDTPFNVFITNNDPYPSAPVGLSATNINSSGFTANWNAVNNATSYELIVDNNSPINVGNVITYNVSSLTGTTHSFKVRAKNSVFGSYSSVFNVSLASSSTTTFNYSGNMQTFTVPDGVTSLTIEAKGAQGGNGHNIAYQPGGLGGYIKGAFSVTPGSILNIYVGGTGGRSNVSPVAGGFNGGGNGYNYGNTSWTVAGGGGASDVRLGGTALSNRIIVAGGGGAGGGSGSWPNGAGGKGGGNTGQAGYWSGSGGAGMNTPDTVRHGFGGSQSAGGAGGNGGGGTLNGFAGTLGLGGNASTGNNTLAGGGGGGFYGGGGGGYHGGAGGGGSNYILPSATNVTNSQGTQTGNGQIIIQY